MVLRVNCSLLLSVRSSHGRFRFSSLVDPNCSSSRTRYNRVCPFRVRWSSRLVYHGLQIGSFGLATCRRPWWLCEIPSTSVLTGGDGWLEAGVRGIEYSSELSSLLDDGDDCGAATWIVRGPVLSIEFNLWPRWVISFVPRATSTPGVAAKHRLTSLAQCVYPALNRSASITGFAERRCCLCSLWRWRTVNSRMSAFSSFATFSPSPAKAVTIRSLSSSKHRLIRARRLRSSIGFITCKLKKKNEHYRRLFFFLEIWSSDSSSRGIVRQSGSSSVSILIFLCSNWNLLSLLVT